MTSRRRIVVYGEHTRAATEALRWAVQKAEQEGATIVVVRPFDRRCRADLALERDLDRARREARYRSQAWVVEAVADLDSSVPISVSTPDASAAQALVTAAQGASLVVIGDDHGSTDAPALAATVREVGGCPVQLLRLPVAVH